MQTKEIDIQDIWSIYQNDRSDSIRHKLMLHYIWLVKYVIRSMKVPSNSLLTEEDFTSIGVLGLHEAIQKYDPSRGVKFESYSIPRIKGTIQDELRKLDWLSRSTRKKANDMLVAGDELRGSTGREVSSEEIRRKLALSPEKYKTYLAAAAAAKASLSMNESSHITINRDGEEQNFIEELPDSEAKDILEDLGDSERVQFITDFIKNLKEKKRHVMMLYYYEDLTFKEIGNVINVSESRVCQIHTQVINSLREKLIEFDND